MLECLLPDIVNVKISFDDIRLISNLINNRTSFFTQKSFFFAILGITPSQSAPLGDIEGSGQIIPDKYKSEKPIYITAIDKILLKCDCINGSTVKRLREPIL